MEPEKLTRGMTARFSILIFVLGMFSCNAPMFEKDISTILGVEAEIENRELFEEWAGVQGDGYIIEVYKLSNKTIQDFLDNPKSLEEKQNKNKSWNKYGWTNEVLDDSLIEVRDIAFNYKAEDKQIAEMIGMAKNSLNKKSTFIAFYYRPSKEFANNVQAFILDTSKNILFAIDHQL